MKFELMNNISVGFFIAIAFILIFIVIIIYVIKKPIDENNIENRLEIKCPYCSSYDTKNISSISRLSSVGLFGLGSKKIGKQWHCNHCNSDF